MSQKPAKSTCWHFGWGICTNNVEWKGTIIEEDLFSQKTHSGSDARSPSSPAPDLYP
jgi:hypothetical protein